MFTNCLSHATVSSHTFFILFSIAAITDSFSQYRDVPLNSSITSVQPMTGIVLWTDNHKNKKDAISLEYSYMLYNSVVKEKGVYDWSSVDALLRKLPPEGIRLFCVSDSSTRVIRHRFPII